MPGFNPRGQVTLRNLKKAALSSFAVYALDSERRFVAPGGLTAAGKIAIVLIF